jgi:beta-lactam-binding protein with PASTA domain
MKRVFTFLFGLFLGLLFSLLLANFLLLPILTKSQKIITMPDLTGMTEKEAESEIKRWGLVIGEKKWAYNWQYPEGKVIATHPKARTRVKKGRVVEITLSKGRGKTVVPDFQGKKISEFLSSLAMAGLLSQVETIYGEEDGVIKTCIPQSGTTLEKGSIVRVLVSQKEGFVVMPRVIGLKLETAKRLLDSLNLKIDEIREKESEEEPGVVIFQYPEEEMRVRSGGKVVLVLAKRKE